MRSLFGRFIPGTSGTFGVLLSGLTLYSGVALAEEPIAPSEGSSQPSVVTQSTTTTVTTAAPPAALPPPPVMAAPPAPVYAAPPPVYSAPPAPMPYQVPYQMAAPPAPPMPPSSGSFQGPVYFNGPVWIIPAPSSGQAVAPPLPPPPVYMQQPPTYAPPAPVYMPPRYAPMRRAVLFPNRRHLAPAYKAPRGPVVGMGVRFSMLGVSSQKVFGQDMNLYGGGIFMRFRSQGRFGFEMALDAMRSNIKDDAFVRTSYPFTVSPMLYLFQNRPENHFNIYAIAGFGLMADDVTLYKGTSRELNQQFWEVLGQAGGGIEVRFSKLALFTDVRAIGMLLDDSSPAGIFYQNVDGGPIPASSAGYKVNAGALLWF